MKIHTFSLLILLNLILSTEAYAKVFQILHTNDLHGFFEHSVEDKEIGGYDTIKTLIDTFKGQAKENNVESLVLDSGDFMEGNLFYMAKKGRRVWGIMNEMGYDAVAVGNHDYLMGTSELNSILKENRPNFAFLASNFNLKPGLLHSAIRKEIKEYKIFKINGLNIAVVGATTNEIVYKWRFKGGKISNPIKSVNKVAKKLKKKGLADFVIALTHIGIFSDIELAEKSEHIDLIVGGHSHTSLFEPKIKENKNGIPVPIVQTGEHGKYFGKLLIDLTKGKTLKVLDYKLIPVNKKSIEQDSRISEYIRVSKKLVETKYNKKWLDEIVGRTDIPLISSNYRLTPWTALITDAIKDSVNADISFHQSGFAGTDLPVGDITVRDVFNSHPRVFDTDDKFGWNVYSVDVYGVVLKMIVRVILKGQHALSFSGITFDLLNKDNEEIEVNSGWLGDHEGNQLPDWDIISRFLGVNGKFRVTNIRINGQEINPLRKYRVALNEGIVVGGLGISSVVKFLLRKITKSKITIWDALMTKISEIGVIDQNYGNFGSDFDINGVNRSPKIHKSLNRGFIPSVYLPRIR